MFNAWAAENHIRASEITAVDKLSFIGKRGMGALEFEPAQEFDKERNFQLAELHLYKPSSFDFVIDAYGIEVENARWEEMGNGAKRLTAMMNGIEHKAIISPKSQRGKEMVADGGTKMDMGHLKKWVENLLLPKCFTSTRRSRSGGRCPAG